MCVCVCVCVNAHTAVHWTIDSTTRTTGITGGISQYLMTTGFVSLESLGTAATRSMQHVRPICVWAFTAQRCTPANSTGVFDKYHRQQAPQMSLLTALVENVCNMFLSPGILG